MLPCGCFLLENALPRRGIVLVVWLESSKHLGIVAEEQAGTKSLLAINYQSSSSWHLLQRCIELQWREGGLVVRTQGMQRHHLGCAPSDHKPHSLK